MPAKSPKTGNTHSLPKAFMARMLDQLGENEALALFQALETEPPRSLRLNAQKLREFQSDFDQNFPFATPIHWAKLGRWLPSEGERPNFAKDSVHQAGGYYVQEASSMLIEWALPRFEGPVTALDLCAAPGGKSTHLYDLLTTTNPNSLVVSHEPEASRVKVLAENLNRWGAHRSIVIQSSPERLAEGMMEAFDLILVDAPCSGEGMFRKDKASRAQWNAKSPAGCAVRQRRIVESAVAMLKPGGWLLYSTCTFSPLENDEIGDFLVRQGLESRPQSDPPNGLLATSYGHQAFPHHFAGEGFYIARFQKPNSLKSPDSQYITEENSIQSIPQTMAAEVMPWLEIEAPECLTLVQDRGLIHAIDEDMLGLVNTLAPLGNLWKVGTPVGAPHLGKPHPALALGVSVRPKPV